MILTMISSKRAKMLSTVLVLCIMMSIFNSRCAVIVPNLVYMRIPYTSKLLNTTTTKSVRVGSANQCLELCRDLCNCKSVGIETSSMTCYLYDNRVYAGLPGTDNSDMIYYWQLEPECPIHLGYSEYSTSKICTKYNSTAVTWLEAQTQCEREGGMLFMENTLGVIDDYLINELLDSYTFLGATDVNDEAVWEWFNGVPVNTDSFRPGEPNNVDGIEHCMVYSTKKVPFGLVDLECERTKGFICQIPTQQTYLP